MVLPYILVLLYLVLLRTTHLYRLSVLIVYTPACVLGLCYWFTTLEHDTLHAAHVQLVYNALLTPELVLREVDSLLPMLVFLGTSGVLLFA